MGIYLGPLSGELSDEQAKVKALKPEDREWLTQHGWRDTSNDYPEIGTEKVIQP